MKNADLDPEERHQLFLVACAAAVTALVSGLVNWGLDALRGEPKDDEKKSKEEKR